MSQLDALKLCWDIGLISRSLSGKIHFHNSLHTLPPSTTCILFSNFKCRTSLVCNPEILPMNAGSCRQRRLQFHHFHNLKTLNLVSVRFLESLQTFAKFRNRPSPQYLLTIPCRRLISIVRNVYQLVLYIYSSRIDPCGRSVTSYVFYSAIFIGSIMSARYMSTIFACEWIEILVESMFSQYQHFLFKTVMFYSIINII